MLLKGTASGNLVANWCKDVSVSSSGGFIQWTNNVNSLSCKWYRGCFGSAPWFGHDLANVTHFAEVCPFLVNQSMGSVSV